MLPMCVSSEIKFYLFQFIGKKVVSSVSICFQSGHLNRYLLLTPVVLLFKYKFFITIWNRNISYNPKFLVISLITDIIRTR